MNRYDVIIVGAGPAGTSCAITIAQKGFSVLLCDRERFPRHKICGDCINPAAWSLLESLGVAEEIKRKRPAPIERVLVNSTGGKTLEALVPWRSSEPFFAMRRDVFDTVLLERARKVQVEILEGSPVREIQWNEGWSVRLGQQVVRGRILIGADGRNSIVAQRFGSSVRRTGPRSGRRVGVQWFCSFQPAIRASVALFLFEQGYCGVVNVDDQHANVAMVTTPELVQRSRKAFPSFLEETLLSNAAARANLSHLSPSIPLSSAFPIDPVCRQSRHPQAFLVGDARQTLEPFTGEGICAAIVDGVSLARDLLQENSRDSLSGQARIPLVNSAFTFVLKRPALANRFVEIGTVLPPAVSQALKTIFPNPSSGLPRFS